MFHIHRETHTHRGRDTERGTETETEKIRPEDQGRKQPTVSRWKGQRLPRAWRYGPHQRLENEYLALLPVLLSWVDNEIPGPVQSVHCAQVT